MSLPRKFFAQGVNDYDIAGWQADPDDVDYQKRKDEAIHDFLTLGEIPPPIHCVSDLKRARAELAVLKADRIAS